MTVRALLRWNNADSTSDLNARFNYLAEMGVEWGGAVVPGVGLSVTLDPFVANSHEGMLVISDSVEPLTVAAGITNVIVAYVKYNPGGVPALPIQQITVFDLVTYNAHPDKPYMIVLAEVVLPPAAVIVNASDIKFLNRNEITPVSRSQFRGTLPWASLPVPASPTNRVGDFYWVPDKKVFYFWTGLVWEPINTGSYSSEVTLNNNQLAYSELIRRADGWGVVSGRLQDSSADYAGYPTVDFIPSLLPNVFTVNAFAAHLNGHYIETKRTAITLGAAPPVVDRFDLIFLEAWREDVIDPGSVTYDNSAGGSYTLEQASDVAEQLTWNAATTAFDVHEINSRNHAWNNMRFRLSFTPGVAPDNLYDWSAAAAASLNVDGNPFTTDLRYWVANSTTSRDGKSYAIPLFIVRRYAGEPFIREYHPTTGIRYVFPVYPICDTTNLVKRSFDADRRYDGVIDGNSAGIDFMPKPSGFITGNKTTLQTIGAANTLRIYDGSKEIPVIRCLGFEDKFDNYYLPQDIPIGTPPAASWSRQLVYLQMSYTMFDDLSDPAFLRYVSKRNFPFIKSVEGDDLDYFGWRRGFITWEIKVGDLGASAITDEDDAFTALGWARATWADGGLWWKGLGGYITSSDYRVSPRDAYFAIPICLLHRRNSAAWDYNTNPNGSGVGRPDGRTSANVIYPDDVLADLRHTVDINEEDLKSLLDSDIDKAMKGQLRTRGANKYLGNGINGEVGGSRILQSDAIGVVPGAYSLPTGDGCRRIWSDAKEHHVVAVSFGLDVDSDDGPTLYQYEVVGALGAPGSYGIITLYAPPGAHLIRHIPGVTYTDNNSAVSSYLDFYGPPCWSTRYDRWENYKVAPAWAKCINRVTDVENILYFCDVRPPNNTMLNAVPANDIYYQPFEVLSTDTRGRATSMRGYVDLGNLAAARISLANSDAALSWWVHYDRSFSAPYDTNRGLVEIPDEVHSAILGPTTGTPAPVNIGPMCITVRKTAVAGAFSITAAEVAALMGLGGVTTLVGIDPTSPIYSLAAAPLAISISTATMDNLQTQIDITLSIAYNGDVDLIVFYQNDEVTNWIEVGRGGKSVQAKFEWQTEDRTAALPAGALAINLGSNIWTQVEYAGRRLSCMPLLWRKVNIGDPWSLYITSTGHWPRADYEYSNVLTIHSSPHAGYNFFRVIFPIHVPLTSVAADYLLLHYTYTPYQGLSAVGGKAPSAPAVLPKLKSMLHGTVLEDGDWYATQSGPCSYFSGVHAFSGSPVNRAQVNREKSLFVNRDVNSLDGMFPEYNGTWLVRQPSTTSKYSYEASGAFRDAQSMNTPAVLRLPFPAFVSMVLNDNPLGVMEFDLDPNRAGSAAGYLNLAPGYITASQGAVGLAASNFTQFTNGLSPFAAALAKNFHKSYGATDMTLLSSSSNMSVESYRITSGAGATLSVSLALGGDGKQICRVATSFQNVNATGLLEAVRSSLFIPPGNTVVSTTDIGAFIYSSSAGLLNRWAQYTYSGSVVGTYQFQVTTHPGELLQWLYADSSPSAQLFLQYLDVAGLVNPNDSQIFSTLVVGTDPAYQYSLNTRAILDQLSSIAYSQRLDTIKIPVAYGQGKSNVTLPGLVSGPDYRSSGREKLKGTVIGYPSTWTVPMVAFADSLWEASEDDRNTGRGIYCGTDVTRFVTPVLVPGSGTDLPVILRLRGVHGPSNMTPPETYAYMPATQLFDDPVRNYFHADHGGGLAYVFRGLMINPSSSVYKDRVVIQISGGPTGGPVRSDATLSDQFNSNDLTATAIDAFWPSGRPILTRR